MKRIARALALSTATVTALALPAASAQAGTSARPGPTTTTTAQRAPSGATSLVTAGTTVTGATDITSPVDGTAYVAGVDDAGHVTVQRWAHDARGRVTSTTVAVPDAARYALVDLDSAGGRAFLTVDRGAGAGLYELVGTTARPLPLPTTAPVAGTTRTPVAVAATATGEPWVVFASQVGPGAPYDLYGARLVGGTWTFTTVIGRSLMEIPRNAYAIGDELTIIDTNVAAGTVKRTWDGAAWSERTIGIEHLSGNFRHDQTTVVSPTDITEWGFGAASLPGASGTVGTCSHVVGGVADPCPAPSWPVYAAARLADGRVLLGGGSNGARLAVVATPGATPTPLDGAAGTYVAALAAPPTGGTVWALAQSGGYRPGTGATATVVQVMGAPATRLPAPKKPKRPVHPAPHAR